MNAKTPNSGHMNVTEHSKATGEASDRCFDRRIHLLRGIVDERKANFEPMGGLPRSVSAFLGDDWLPSSITDIEESDKRLSPDCVDEPCGSDAYKISRSTFYVDKNEGRRADVDALLKIIKEPQRTKKTISDKDLEIKKLNAKVILLAQHNTDIEENYKAKVNGLEDEIKDLRSELDKYKMLLKHKPSNVTNLFDL